jgi:3-deoxy-D-manno-octulosonic-acid transferase
MKRLVPLFYSALTRLLFIPFLVFLGIRLVRHPAYRAGLRERFGYYPPFKRTAGQRLLWIHAVSVGEVLSAGVLLGRLRDRYPDCLLILSTGTPTGRATAEAQWIVQKRLVDRAVYFPFDFPWIVRRAVRTFSPTLFIFLETELWPSFLRALAERDIPSLLVNGRISPASFRSYKMIRPLLRSLFDDIRCLSMQTEEDAERIISLGAPPTRVVCTGNMKYDQAATAPSKTPDEWRDELGLRAASPLLFIAGSLHPGEEGEVLAAYAKLSTEFPTLVLLMAPRHLTRLDEVEREIRGHGLASVRKTEIVSFHRPGEVIVLDTFGELASLYSVADLIFVGGSLVPIGGHNVLEAAALRKVVLFGPHMENFREVAARLLAVGGGIEIANADEMAGQMRALLHDSNMRRERGEAAWRVVMENQGAVERNLAQIARWIR